MSTDSKGPPALPSDYDNTKDLDSLRRATKMTLRMVNKFLDEDLIGNADVEMCLVAPLLEVMLKLIDEVEQRRKV